MQLTRLKTVQGKLAGMDGSLESDLGELTKVIEKHKRVQGNWDKLNKTSARKARLRSAAKALEERQALMEEELSDLPNQVKNKYMPARKELLLHMFIPEAQRRLKNLQQARAFVHDLLDLQHERLQTTYLQRAIYNRFQSRQFERGITVAMSPTAAQKAGMHNLVGAYNRFFRTLQHNFEKQHPRQSANLDLAHQDPMEHRELLAFVKAQFEEKEDAGPPCNYIVLPGPLPLNQALKLMNEKDALLNGLPRLVLVWVGKFDARVFQTDAPLREAYFKALKRNVVINIDGRSVVDNPFSISHRLLLETLGSTSDTAEVEELPDDEEKVAFRV